MLSAIYEQIFELHQPSQLMEKDTDSEDHTNAMHSYILKATARKGYFLKKTYDQNNLFIVKSIPKIIIHAVKLLRKNFECLTSKPNTNGTF